MEPDKIDRISRSCPSGLRGLTRAVVRRNQIAAGHAEFRAMPRTRSGLPRRSRGWGERCLLYLSSRLSLILCFCALLISCTDDGSPAEEAHPLRKISGVYDLVAQGNDEVCTVDDAGRGLDYWVAKCDNQSVALVMSIELDRRFEIRSFGPSGDATPGSPHNYVCRISEATDRKVGLEGYVEDDEDICDRNSFEYRVDSDVLVEHPESSKPSRWRKR